MDSLVQHTNTITWIPTNLFGSFTNDTLHIRQHDSLLLDAWSGSAPDAGNFTVNLGATPLQDEELNTTHISGQPFVATFASPGTFTLTAHHDGQTAIVTVQVHAADLGPALSVRAYSPRIWTPPLLDSLAQIESDERISIAETTVDPESGPRNFRASVHHAGNRHVIARLPQNIDGSPSAILARSTIHGFYLANLDETTDSEIIHRYDDGTWLMRGSIVAVNLPADILIRLTTINQGTVFYNGDTTLWLDSTHFDSNGTAIIHYEWAGSGAPKLCNRLHLFLQP